MTFDELTRGLWGTRRSGAKNPTIEHIAFDSRKVRPGTLFVPLLGSRQDGHRFIDQALLKGAVALVGDRRSEVGLDDLAIDPGIPLLVVENSRQVLAVLADRFYHHPFRELTSIGVTGTNGKTTTTFMLESIFKQAGRRCGIVGTIFFRLEGWEIHGQNTTPESLDLVALLRDYIDRGADSVALEVSSHGLQMNRVDRALFDVGIFTNLSPEHLDFHGDMESYYVSKKRLFSELLPASRQAGKTGLALINVDDPYGRRLADEIEGPKVSFGVDSAALVRAYDIRSGLEGSDFVLQLASGRRVGTRLPLLGRHNVFNALAAAGAAEACGIPADAIEQGLARLPAIPGRFEKVRREDGRGPTIYIDYAHTPGALSSSLTALRELHPRSLWVVFGCGGDRDPSKRVHMGEVAGTLADVVVVTNDNPRWEDPARIIEAVEAGLRQAGQLRLESIQPAEGGYGIQSDRRAAIHQAIVAAPLGSVVFIAGKGHETTQEIQGRREPFDDRAVAFEALARWQDPEEVE